MNGTKELIDPNFINLIQEIINQINSPNRGDWYDYSLLKKAAVKLNELTELCKLDGTLLNYLASQNFAGRLMDLTSVRHSVGSMDIACLKMLELLVKAEYSFYLIASKEPLIKRWENIHSEESYKKFSIATKGLVTAFREMQSVYPILPPPTDSINDIHPTLRDEEHFSNETLELCGFCLPAVDSGILLAPDDDFRTRTTCRKPTLYQRLQALPILFRTSKTAFLALFPKNCPGCLAFNICCAGEILSDYPLTTSILNQLLTSNNHQNLSEWEVSELCQKTRLHYHIPNELPDQNPYPSLGDCLSFNRFKNYRFINEMTSLGNKLVSSYSRETSAPASDLSIISRTLGGIDDVQPVRDPRRDFRDGPPRESFSDRELRETRDIHDRPFRQPRENGDGEGRIGFGDEVREREARDYLRRFDRDRDRDGWRNRNDTRFDLRFGCDMNNPRVDNSSKKFDGPLPTAPKASLDADTIAPEPALPIPVLKVVQGKNKKDKKKASKEVVAVEAAEEIARKKAEEEATKQAKAAAKETSHKNFLNSFNVVREALQDGLKGEALSVAVFAQIERTDNLSPEGMLKAVLSALNEKYTVTKWYDQTNYGHLLRSVTMKVSDNESKKEEIQKNLVYIVQDFCYEKTFPTIDIKPGVSKRLIELLLTDLLVGDIVDVEGIIAWADDLSDNDYNGRAEAIIHTTGMITTLRASLEEEEEEGNGDECFDSSR